MSSDGRVIPVNDNSRFVLVICGLFERLDFESMEIPNIEHHLDGTEWKKSVRLVNNTRKL